MPEGQPITVLPGIGSILEGIGRLLPSGFGTVAAGIAIQAVQLQQRVLCLAYLGYEAAEIVGIVRDETGRELPIGEVERIVRAARDWILAGKPQQDAIRSCVEHVERYPDQEYPPIYSGDFERAVVIGGPVTTPGRTPGPMPTVPSAPPPSAPPGRTPAQTPVPQSGRLDPVSLAAAMLKIWQNLLRWRQARQRQNLTFYMPPTPGPMPTVPQTGGPQMPYVSTSLLEGGGNGWGLLNQALQTAAAIWAPNRAMPGGAPLGFQPASYQQTLFDLPLVDVMPQGAGACSAQLTSPFAAGGGRGARAKTHVKCDPITGRAVWFRPAGRPLLWSSDLSATKRVRKIAARARRARGGR